MTINETIIAALTPVLSNIWAVELPPNPTFPALVFEVETTPEQTWVQGGGYDQHAVTIYVLARSRDTVATLLQQVNAALEALPQYIVAGDAGDADFEDDAEVYAYFVTHTLRLPRY